MGVHDRVSRSRPGPSHFVQFFDSDDTRQEAVAGFLGEGYLSGSSLIIVARPVVSKAVLDQRGDFTDARLLEELWNRLLERASISLLCGYAAAHFVAPASHDALRDICTAHSSIRVDPQDPLAAWLLSQAQAQ